MPTAAISSSELIERPQGGWWLNRWGSARVAAGITDRSMTRDALRPHGRGVHACVEGAQVHGASVAVIERVRQPADPIAGCDALLTRLPGTALMVRTADCLPIFFYDARRDVVGLAHAGWRGLAAQLPMRVVGALRHAYRTSAGDLHVAIGPAIRACCYEVGAELSARFGTFVQQRQGRRTCDLIGVAIDQLMRCGVPSKRITDTGRCTSCEANRWFSLRREGSSTGRLTSLIMLHLCH